MIAGTGLGLLGLSPLVPAALFGTITFVMTLAGLQLGRVISRFVPIRIRCDLLVGVALVIEAVVFGLWALFVSPGRHRAGGMGWLARIRLPGSTWALIRRSRR